MPYFYTTLENQVRADGSRGLLFDHYDTLADAEEKLYMILTAAVKSDIPYHSAHIYRSDGLLIEGKVYDRRTEEVQNDNTEL